MNAIRLVALVFVLWAGLSAVPAAAQSRNIIFVNGIGNTVEAAYASADTMKNRLNNSRTRSFPDKKVWQATLVYNPTGVWGASDEDWAATKVGKLLDDTQELFMLKTAEEWYGSTYFEVVSPHNRRFPIQQGTAQAISDASQNNLTPAQTYLESEGVFAEADFDGFKAAIGALHRRIVTKAPAVVVAHSQGNFVANFAWARLVSVWNKEALKMAAIVNVANNTRYAPHRLDLTHADDQALEKLKNLGAGQTWWRQTPDCAQFCNFTLAVTGPTYGGADTRAFDLDHGFIDTYLSERDLPDVVWSQGVIHTPGRTTFFDRFEDLVYAADIALSWPVRLRPGNSVTAEFDFQVPQQANLLNVTFHETTPNANQQPSVPSFRLRLYDGAALLAQRTATGSVDINVVDEASVEALNLGHPPIDFSSVLSGRMNGRVELDVTAGELYLDPRPSFDITSFRISSSVLVRTWACGGPGLLCERSGFGDTQSVSINGKQRFQLR